MSEKKNTTSQSANAKNYERDKVVYIYGAGIILLGLVVNLLVLYIDASLKSKNPTEILSGDISVSRLILEFFNSVGLAMISIGVVTIILDFRDWKSYFQQRLADIIVDREYLKRLGAHELLSLQNSTMKAFFKVDEIDEKGGFLHYYHKRLRDNIASPYRDKLSMVMNVTEDSVDKHSIIITEILSWNCRKVGVGQRIQKEIRWVPGQDEYQKVIDLMIKLTPPTDAPILETANGTSPSERDENKNETILNFDDLNTEKYKYHTGYRVSLTDFEEQDNLKVEIHAKYQVRKGRFLGWAMSSPTKGFHLMVQYPPYFLLCYELFGIRDEDVLIKNLPGLFYVESEEWILPGEGVAMQQLPPVKEAVIGAELGEASVVAVANTDNGGQVKF